MTTTNQNSTTSSGQAQGASSGTPIALPPLPYGQDALAPAISARTLEFHARQGFREVGRREVSDGRHVALLERALG